MDRYLGSIISVSAAVLVVRCPLSRKSLSLFYVKINIKLSGLFRYLAWKFM